MSTSPAQAFGAAHPLGTTESSAVRRLLIGVALTFLTLFLLVPLAFVFFEALKKGFDVYLAAIVEPDALAAVGLTLTATAIAVPLNVLFGVAAAWAIAKFAFPGKNLLITLIDIDQAFGGWAKATRLHFADGGSFDQIYQPGAK